MPATGVRGWNQKADVGFQPVGVGLFYLSVNSGGKGAQTSDLSFDAMDRGCEAAIRCRRKREDMP